jgi:eukaryotic-like serine/threonine-protein kinase
MSEIDPESEAPGPKDAEPAASDPPTRTETIIPGGEGAVREESELTAGAVLGPFRIVALLGRGGMGVVYEAEDVASGRRVALKVLSPGLRREIDRARFLKEGRLAASLNHPNCVYVFGAWELEGRLVIAMELMRETLADRLKRGGRLPSALAVDAILQVIAGLDAAAAAGILHRDVKPSNCFVDEQGTIKIGDFGISISAHETSETGLVTGRRIVGTPGYASPEQLRGDPVDARTDIYGVGATLYELVTGRPPFDKQNLMSLLMAVANEAPRPPHRVDRTIPSGLSQVIQRCLAKKPEQRYADHAALAAALQLYASSVPPAASPGRRTVAALIDHLILFATFLWMLTSSGFPRDMTTVRDLAIFTVGAWSWRVAYFALLEGVWGASIGKACAGIRVAAADGRPAGLVRASCRSALFVFAFDAIDLIMLVIAPEVLLASPGSPLGFLRGVEARVVLGLAALFCTARRGNGFAGVHDLVTNTRVLERRPLARPATAPAVVNAGAHAAIGRVGPFEILAPSIDNMPPQWSLGFDPVLSRPVWICSASADAPAVSAARRAVNRPTRLRWLAGRRTDGDAWDAYSAPPGRPLLEACRSSRSWADTRWWLWSLAQECLAATRDSTLPRLRLDRVRVVDGGLAHLVDDPSHDTALDAHDPDEASTPGDFLSRVAALALGRGRAAPPLPVGAGRLVRALGRSTPIDAGVAVASLEPLVRRPAATTWRLRLLPIVVCLLPVTASGLNAGLGVWLADPPPPSLNDVRVAAAILRTLDLADRGETPLTNELRDALEVLLASRCRRFLDAPWRVRLNGRDLNLHGSYATVRRRVLVAHPSVNPARQAQAEQTAASFIEEALRQPAPLSVWMIPSFQVGVLWPFAIAGLLISLVFRTGLIRMSGLEVVTASGDPAGRGRLVARSLLMWSPILVADLAQRLTLGVQVVPGVVSLAAIVIMTIGAILTLRTPSRGPHDRLTGTWVVPR